MAALLALAILEMEIPVNVRVFPLDQANRKLNRVQIRKIDGLLLSH